MSDRRKARVYAVSAWFRYESGSWFQKKRTITVSPQRRGEFARELHEATASSHPGAAEMFVMALLEEPAAPGLAVASSTISIEARWLRSASSSRA